MRRTRLDFLWDLITATKWPFRSITLDEQARTIEIQDGKKTYLIHETPVGSLHPEYGYDRQRHVDP